MAAGESSVQLGGTASRSKGRTTGDATVRAMTGLTDSIGAVLVSDGVVHDEHAVGEPRAPPAELDSEAARLPGPGSRAPGCRGCGSRPLARACPEKPAAEAERRASPAPVFPRATQIRSAGQK